MLPMGPVLASARQEQVPAIARALGCNTQTVRNAILAFNRSGLDALTEGSTRPPRIAVAFDGAATERVRALLHRSPRTSDQPTSLWTLEVAATICFREGITTERVTGETIRATTRTPKYPGRMARFSVPCAGKI
jgi:hypothetical protein